MDCGNNKEAPLMLADIILPGSGGDREAHDPERVLGEVLHAVREHLGMDVAFISQFIDGRRVFRCVDAASPTAAVRVGGADPLDDSYCLRVVDGRLPELIRDASLFEEALTLPVTRTLPVGAHLSVPLRLLDGSVYGTFCCFSALPDLSLSDRDLATMRVFAEFTARHLDSEIARRRDHETIRARVQRLMDENLFTLVFQPIYLTRERRVTGYEFFTRFNCEPQRSPDLWFEEAGRVGLQKALELAVISQALDHLSEIPDDIYLALNVSPETLLGDELHTLLAGQPLNQLVLEITEHVLVSDYACILLSLTLLRAKGLRIAVDDAGSGYANFRHILELKPDIIKLDMSITQYVDSDREARALAAALIGFATETGTTVVAEGVETQAQLEVLSKLQVNCVQGYLLGRPVEFGQLAD